MHLELIWCKLYCRCIVICAVLARSCQTCTVEERGPSRNQHILLGCSYQRTNSWLDISATCTFSVNTWKLSTKSSADLCMHEWQLLLTDWVINVWLPYKNNLIVIQCNNVTLIISSVLSKPHRLGPSFGRCWSLFVSPYQNSTQSYKIADIVFCVAWWSCLPPSSSFC